MLIFFHSPCQSHLLQGASGPRGFAGQNVPAKAAGLRTRFAYE
jgi:hypothetical protein